MDKPESAHKIAEFVRVNGLDMTDYKIEDIAGYPTFNAFFYREIKPERRPIFAPGDDGIVVSPADSRMVVFPTLQDATEIWVKGAVR